ncbi:MAG: hypothetical protein ACLTA2_22120, partial [[Clostridium] innocuum]
WFSAAFSFPCMLLLYGKSDTACGIYGGLLCLLQCIILLLTLLPVEHSLHKIFNRDGSRKAE